MPVRPPHDKASAAAQTKSQKIERKPKASLKNWQHLFPKDSGHDITDVVRDIDELNPHVVQLLRSLFTSDETVVRLATAFDNQVNQTVAKRSEELLASDLARIKDPAWLLDEVQYMGYVNFIGSRKGQGTFATLKEQLSYINDKLGASVVYALPFLSSPFGDAGFDVSDYKDVDPRFGGLEQFRAFRKELAAKSGALQMDLVLNHVSVEHEWAKKALAGDGPEASKYRSYFQILNQAPNVAKVTLDSAGLPLSAQYVEKDAEGNEHTIQRRVVFPAFADPAHPHYTKMIDGRGQNIWVYHTFYPFQWDLNFTHPEIVEETLQIIAFWANEGADILRLDAIPHLFKKMESDPRVMKVVELLRYFLAQAAPRTSLVVEANQSPAVVYKYFGEPATIPVEHLDCTVQTTSGAQMAYNFDQAIHSWASLLTGDKSFLLEGLQRSPEAPANTLWANFLRSHDELSLSKAPDKIRDVIQRELIDTKRGVPFRGARGVGGRMANFLDHDVRRHKMAHAHLLSLNGHPILYYGDEIMAKSDNHYAQSAAKARGGSYDSRDEGRGPIAAEDFQAAMTAGEKSAAGQSLAYIRRLVELRKQRISLRRGQLKQNETSHPGVASYTRFVLDKESTLVVLNLTGETIMASIRSGQPPLEMIDLITGRRIEFSASGDECTLTLAPYEALWI